ncbi:MAG: MarC family protein [Candidatus Jettenia sp. CY-1]|nr:MAG: MarC family protein [Candidatus Jettenia sp. CY-1]
MRRKRACISAIGCFVAAFMGYKGYEVLAYFNFCPDVCGGIILFLVALRTVMQMSSSTSVNNTLPSTPTLTLAVFPLSFPAIVTPCSIAILIILMAAAQDAEWQAGLLVYCCD